MDIERVASRFPLAPRTRPAGKRLSERVDDLAATARNLETDTRPGTLAAASRVHNQAALIASDAGLHARAHRLCWDQAELYRKVLPLDTSTARLALEPIVNLARLLIRSGDGAAASRLLDTLYEAVSSAASVVIDGRELRLDHLTATDADQQEIARWVWNVRLADGVRALAAAGQWNRAATQAQRCGGVGRRLLDGRQAIVLARLVSGHSEAALDMVQRSASSEPWEQAVQSCLDLLCRLAGGMPTRNESEEVLYRYHGMPDQLGLIVFHTRLGLTAVDLADAAGNAESDRLVTRLADRATAAADGYAAREILFGHRNRLPSRQTTALESVVQASGLDAGTIPDTLMTEIITALETSRHTMTQILGTRGT
ncbi:hypothetical protein [Haloactinomyces albus]|uniref:Uncharacterized protein n=1 Tax=Haloactinomyces albus TaxID=1352928 RepID=A0AAE4CQI1_9ACTN|nr:hypothetical protein [Haloactinomyces albus]MDR7304152.1 hypothetical protein [Haloactinomyces albus]